MAVGHRAFSVSYLYHFPTKIFQVLEKDSWDSVLEPGTGTEVTYREPVTTFYSISHLLSTYFISVLPM